MRGVEILDVKNDWVTNYLKGKMHSLDLSTIKEFSLNIWLEKDSWIKVDIIMQEELLNINLYGAAV